MELAPLTGLADAIVDLVATGGTLKANALAEVEEIMQISAAADRQPRGAEAQARADPAADRRAGEGGRRGWRDEPSRSAASTAATPISPSALTRAAAPMPSAGRRRDRGARRRDPRRRARARRCRGAGVHQALRPARRWLGSPSSSFRATSCSAALAGAAAGAARRARSRRRPHPRLPRAPARRRRPSWSYRDADGSLLGQKVTPLDRVGIYVPGGKAAYPSSC